MATSDDANQSRITKVRRLAYSSATLGVVAATVAVLGAPIKWSFITQIF